ncbi:MAG: endonuclease/exonuclease/phosphatase family protein [Lewinellaceae bacterium]|nr:endonuclease/exonuclease/phosphatase family protein [Lewinellaceae bacterium]
MHFILEKQGLIVQLSGNVSDPNNEILNGEVHWGDQSIGYFGMDEFQELQKTHHYALPGTYRIKIQLLNSSGIVVKDSAEVKIDFLETSLSNVQSEFFTKTTNEFLVLTLNLHTYQEDNQNEKFNIIADVIGKLNIDFVAFQECAQNRNASMYSGNIRTDNMALKINEILEKKYNKHYEITWDWAHYGWQIYEEGICILSKELPLEQESRIVSKSTSKEDITTRKVIYGAYQKFGRQFNIFSAHLHWRQSLNDEEQNNQIKALKAMAIEKEASSADAITIVAGDFNGNPTSSYPYSEGYTTMVGNGDYIDAFLAKNPNANVIPADPRYYTVGGSLPGRIDYIFIKNNDKVNVKASQILFTNQVIGVVSDHFGVLTKLEVVQ